MNEDLRGTGITEPIPKEEYTISDIGDDGIRAMFFADPGAGKTTLIGTAADDERTWPGILLDLEGGLGSIRSKVRLVEGVKGLGNPEKGKLDVVRIKRWTDIQEVYDWMWNDKYEAKRSIYRSISADSMSEVNYLALRHVMAKNTGGQPRLEADVPEQRDYLKANNLMKVMLRGFRDIEGLHVFMTALAQLKAEESSAAMIMPSLIGKLSAEAMAIVDYVGYLRSNVQKEREMIFQPEGRIRAKERTEMGKQIKVLKNPTMTTFLDALGR